MTQASQAGGGRSTANINKNTDQLGGLALTRRPIRRETSPNTWKSSPTTLPNKATKQRNESRGRRQCEGGRRQVHQGSAMPTLAVAAATGFALWRPAEVISQQV